MKYQRVTTHLAETMSKLDVDKAMRDDYAKCILADPQILANIVKVIVPEFREYSIKDIIPCIGETIVSLTVPEKLCIKIESDGTEDVDIEDGKIIYDIRFPLYYNNRTIKILVNVEAQKSISYTKLGYHIESRMVYYMARLVSSQKNVEFIKSNYDDIKDVYSIWICMDTEADEDSIIELGLQPRVIYGNTSWLPQRSIMNGAVIRIRSRADVEESKNKLIAMLEVLFSCRARQDKMNRLEEYGEPLRYVGELFRTYILAERGDEVCIIDKHAAHERQLFEKLAANYGDVPSQLLLEPLVIELSAEEKTALLANLPLLESAGLEVSDFGGSSVCLRSVPADVEQGSAEDLLVELAAKLAHGSRDALNERTEWVLHSISCRAAIKAGDHTSPQELMALAEKILSGEVPPFCPHGRPCVLKLTRKELEKQFGRIV